MNHKGILVVMSGFSGSGKGTLVKRLLDKYDNYALSVSSTTRAPRSGECEGREYFFKTREEFHSMIQKDEFIEYARYVDNYYGTPKQYVQEQLDAGKDVILEIEMQGALKVKEKIRDTLLLFVTPPSISELQRRLIGRGTEPGEIVKARMAQAKEEAKYLDFYDHILVNETNKEEACVDEIHQVIQSAHTKTSQNRELIKQLREQLKEVM